MNQFKSIFILLIFCLTISIASADLMSIQGQVTDSSGNPSSGDLQVLIYDNSTGGNLVYNSSSDFNDAIVNGRYDVVLGSGEELSLVYGRVYYMDLLINGEDLDFSGSERQVFQSNVGEINSTAVPLVINGSGINTIDEVVLHVIPGDSAGSGVVVGRTSNASSRTILSDGGLSLHGPLTTGTKASNLISFRNLLSGETNESWGLGLSPASVFGNVKPYRFYINELVNNSIFVNRLVIQNGTGNVGIGTDNPQTKLQIYDSSDSEIFVDGEGVVSVQAGGGSATTASMSVKGNQSAILGFSDNPGDSNWQIGLPMDGRAPDDFMIWDNVGNGIPAGMRLIVKQDGKVGINTFNPESTLGVNGSVSVSNKIFTSELQVTDVSELSNILLVPTDSPALTCESGNKGAMYMDDSLSKPCFCDGTNWVLFENSSTTCS